MKRFYKLVSTAKEPEGYTILLDDRPVKTPNKNILYAPNEAIANLIVQEWAQQEEEIVPDAMPVTQILNTQLEKVTHKRAAMTPQLLAYLDTDLICYLDEELKAAQEEHWKPSRTWFEKRYGAPLKTTTVIAALQQDPQLHAGVKDDVGALDDARFTILQLATPLTGSLILGLHFTHGQATAAQLLKASFVEEDQKDILYNAEKYGPDPLTEKKKQATLRDLKAAEEYLKAL